ncbi:MAG TPA: SDR family oxidoreductase [Pyrinomonadaceae bacterium]|jgi:short-subunit dehydrogenase|nr:SDR family oxidoreductase [Pyrinomonadaceae bacterium]
MDVKLKKLGEQVVVITGASSGIGLVTAREAARRGAKLVVAARAEEALRQLAGEINSRGGEAVHVAADVGRQDDVRRIAETALERFGRIDTWVNNAGVSIYGKIVDTPVEDMRRLFETDFWGMVYGSLAAVQHLRQRGGALINVGSTVGDRAIPLQGVYSASKHAVKGFTDALRMELEEEGAPVSVTLIKPGAIDTQFTKHAKNLMETEPALPPPVYAPEAVAEAILHCAETPVRDVFVGFGGKALGMMDKYAPRLGDKVMETFMFGAQKKDEPARGERERGLYEASGELKERSGDDIYVSESSVYTKAALHPVLTGALFVGAGLATAALVSKRRAKADGKARARSKGAGAWPSAAGPPAEG